MHLNVEQRKLVQARPGGHSLIKGVAGSGKTTVAVYRIPFLLSNYCFASDDRILLVTFNKTLVNYIKYLYKKVEDEIGIDYLNLFSGGGDNLNDKVEIFTIDRILYKYFSEHQKSSKCKYEVLTNNRLKYEILADCLAEISKRYPDLKLLKHGNEAFLLDEIQWIKSCKYLEIEEYQIADRLGRMNKLVSESSHKLAKNSKVRQAIYELMGLYNKTLKSKSYLDFNDMAILALQQAGKKTERKYTHILIDEGQDLTRIQLEFLRLLYNEKEYSSLTFIADIAQSIYPHAWLIKGRSFTSINLDMVGRSNSLTKNYRTTSQIAMAAYSLLESDPELQEDNDFVRPALIDRQGVYPVLKQFSDLQQEANYIVKEISTNLLGHYTLRDIVVIARQKNQLNYIKEHLEKEGIPCLPLDKKEVDFEAQALRLMTMHSIKGLEFKVVMIVGIKEGVLPYTFSRDADDQINMESIDRRLLYVGMTRALELLYLTTSAPPSHFLKDINPQYMRLNTTGRIGTFYPVSTDNYLFKSVADSLSSEEKVRQWFLQELIKNYKFPVNLIDVEYKINALSAVGSVDVAVSVIKNGNKVPHIFAEMKSYGQGIEKALSQVKSYMSHYKTCSYGVATDGNEIVVIDKDFEKIDDFPVFDPSMIPAVVQRFQFLDLRGRRQWTLLKEMGDQSGFIVENEDGRSEYEHQALKELPVYSNIAAGNPTFINPSTDEYFSLPDGWLRGGEPHFFLRVRGDSMIGAEINDGDLVLIHRQQTAQNREIVAVTIDEDATLKRFMKMGDTVLLIPENDKYEPIQMRGDQISIIGVAVGILKRE